MSENVITKEYIQELLGTRKRNAHKGDNGKGLLIAGSDGFSGAAVMASASALRSGIGTLKTASLSSQRDALLRLPEAMFCDMGESWQARGSDKIDELIADATVIACGPGMGRSAGVLNIVEKVAASKKPAIIDADGLNATAKKRGFKELLHTGLILTPHMGEMSRLTRESVIELTVHARDAACRYAKEWGCVVLLKGSASYIADPEGRWMVNKTGNAGLAKGGSGDVLTGIILAMLGQKLKPFDAACAGAFLLGASAETAMDVLRERMLMARDVIDAIEGTLKWK